MPDPAQLPLVPTFDPAHGATNPGGLELLAAAAVSPHIPPGDTTDLAAVAAAINKPGPYNPAATLPSRIVKRILDLEFVEMAELKGDIWCDEPAQSDTGHQPRRIAGKPPVTDIRIWLECYGRMAAILATRFPLKAPELWAYQATIVKATHNYEGANWVAYDRQFRRDMLARKDLNWSTPNTRLYNEAFTGRARAIPRCPHCLCEDHIGAHCPHNPNPLNLGWFPDPRQLPQPITRSPLLFGAPRMETCRNFNHGRCRFTRCRYLHSCSECGGPHPAVSCPRGATLATGEARNRSRQGPSQPFFPARR